MSDINFNLEKKISVILSIWLSIIVVFIAIIASNKNSKFYTIGPNENLDILGIKINSYYKYNIIIIYSIINALFRSSNNILLANWLINNVCDTGYKLNPKYKGFSYWITTITHIYTWVDWLIYYNLSLSQIDMFIIEVFSEAIIANCLTKYYLSYIIPNYQKESNTNQCMDQINTKFDYVKVIDDFDI